MFSCLISKYQRPFYFDSIYIDSFALFVCFLHYISCEARNTAAHTHSHGLQSYRNYQESLLRSRCLFLTESVSLSLHTYPLLSASLLSVDVTDFRDRKEQKGRERDRSRRRGRERGSAAAANWNPVALGSRGVPQSWGFTRCCVI